MNEIKVLGGGHSVGGNKILLKFDNNSVWLDMGITYKYRLELPEYNIIRGFSLKRLVSEGLFPQEAVAESMKKKQGERYLNVLISHAHSDHYALITYFRAWQEAKTNLRLYAPIDAYRTLQARFELGNLRKVLTNINYRATEEAEAENFEAHPIKVDHSMDASYGYVVETPKIRVGYTGDFRFTSEKDFTQMTKAFQGVDCLICEATRVVSHGLQTEEDVRRQVMDLMNRFFNSTVVFIVGWYTYTKRVRTIIEASGGRKVVLHSKIAHMLEAADPTMVKNPRVFVLQLKPKEKLPPGYNSMTLEEVNQEHGNVVVVIPDTQKRYLWKEETPESILVRPGDVVISSLSEPYDEDSAHGLLRLADWVTYELKVPLYHVHASGHAPIDRVADFVNAVKPKKLYVVHFTCQTFECYDCNKKLQGMLRPRQIKSHNPKGKMNEQQRREH